MTMTLKQLHSRGARLLKKSGVLDAQFDAWVLLEDIFCVSRADVLANTQPQPDAKAVARYLDACQRRSSGMPLQYILGHWEFMGLDFQVNSSVLIPRSDTETLVEYIMENYSGRLNILDMCCGSGCIGLSVKHFLPDSKVTLCDISDSALLVAKHNAVTLNLDVKILKYDLMQDFRKYFYENQFDIIVSNPPYIKSADMASLQRELTYEPRIALDGGQDGMKYYNRLISGWQSALRPGGEMILESGYDTQNDIYLMFLECEYSDVLKRRDINGTVRLVAGKKGLGK